MPQCLGSTRIFYVVLALLFALGLMAACGGSSSPTPTPVAQLAPTDTVSPAETPLPASTEAPPTDMPAHTAGPVLQSQGLGMLWEDWLAKMGEPEQDLGGMYQWDGAQWTVFRYNGRIMSVQRSWPTGGFVDKDTARATAQSLTPRDAMLIEEYTSASGNEIEVYHSDQLKAAYPDGLYTNAEPGDFMVSYWPAVDLNGTFLGYSSVNIATGNNP